MARPAQIDEQELLAWLSSHAGWTRRPGKGLFRAYAAKDFAGALGFVVQIGLLAEKRDHHPDLELGWGRASAHWCTHDAGGVTRLDTELAEATDGLAAQLGLTAADPTT